MYLKTDFKTHTPDNKHRTFQIKTSQDTITETNATDKLKPQTPLKHMTSPSSCEKQAHLNTAYTDTRDLATSVNAPFNVSLSFDPAVMILQLLINMTSECAEYSIRL